MEQILSVEFFHTLLRIGTPLLYGALGAFVCKKVGIMNIGIEGIMLLSAFAGVVGSAYSQNLWIGILSGLGVGVATALLFTYFVIQMKADPILIGMAVNIFASGGTVFMLNALTGDKGVSSSLKSLTIPNLDLPPLGNFLSGHNSLTYLVFLVFILIALFLVFTPMGLRIRSVGENKNAALSVGINVNTVYYTAFAIAGLCCALGGLYLSMGYVSWFSRDMTAGRGFIAMAAANLGQGSILGIGLAVLVFAVTESVVLSLQVFNIPSELIQTVPYIATIIGLILYSKR